MNTKVVATVLAFLTLAPTGAYAAAFELIYKGSFNTQDALNAASQAAPGYFTGNTPFTVNAYFDTNSPNLAPVIPMSPFDGFRAYSPTLATISIAGTLYTMDTIITNPTAGITVAIFDQNSFTPGHYAVGILQQPPLDGAGIIGDFVSASPDFTANNITPVTFTNYFGVGYASGICQVGPSDNCTLNAVTPMVLRNSANKLFSLTLGNYDEDYPAIHDPLSSFIPGPVNSAQLVATPEPATSFLTALSLLALMTCISKRRLPTAEFKRPTEWK